MDQAIMNERMTDFSSAMNYKRKPFFVTFGIQKLLVPTAECDALLDVPAISESNTKKLISALAKYEKYLSNPDGRVSKIPDKAKMIGNEKISNRSVARLLCFSLERLENKVNLSVEELRALFDALVGYFKLENIIPARKNQHNGNPPL
jgi:hypothetical protein